MKRDGRTLDHKTLEELRLMAMERVREGEQPSAVMQSFGFCRTTIYKWQRQAKGRKRLDAIGANFIIAVCRFCWTRDSVSDSRLG